MTQTRECTATGQFVRFVEGFGMVVANGVEPVTVPVHAIPALVRDGVIEDPLDHDGDGEPGGSKPADPPALTGKNKAELLKIAADEGVIIPDGAKNAQIAELIEASRQAKANPAPAQDPAPAQPGTDSGAPDAQASDAGGAPVDPAAGPDPAPVDPADSGAAGDDTGGEGAAPTE